MDLNKLSPRSRRRVSNPDGLPPLEYLPLDCLHQAGGEITPYEGNTPTGSEPSQGSDTEGILYWVLMAPIRLVVYIFTSDDIDTSKAKGILLLEEHPNEKFLSPRVLPQKDIKRLLEEDLGLREEPSVYLDDSIDTWRYANRTGPSPLWYSIEGPHPQIEYPLHMGTSEPEDQNSREPKCDITEAYDEDVAEQLAFLYPGRQRLCNIL
jgi:hypothetical protein